MPDVLTIFSGADGKMGRALFLKGLGANANDP